LPMSHDIAFSVAHPDCPPPLLPGPFGVASFGQDPTGQAARSASRYRNGTAQPRYLARNSAILVRTGIDPMRAPQRADGDGFLV
jgi:hypothetical protein